MSRQKIHLDQISVPAGTPTGQIPVVEEGELRYSPGGGTAADVEVTPTGGMESTTVQDALVELDEAVARIATRVTLPLTTVISGAPELVWGTDDSLITTEMP